MPQTTYWSTIAGLAFHERTEYYLLNDRQWPTESIADHVQRLVDKHLENSPFTEETGIRVSKALPSGLIKAEHPDGFNKSAVVAVLPLWQTKAVRWLTAQEALGWHVWTAPDGTPGVEVEVRYELGGHPVIGSIDLVLENHDTGEIWLLDWKGLALDTPIATPDGWTTMGDVRVGDYVLGADGKPTRVKYKSKVKRLRSFRVSFDDGSSVVCDEEHVWETTNRSGTAVRGVQEIRDTLYGSNGQRQHKVRNAAPLDLPESTYDIDPYVLGVWLGDGKHTGGDFCGSPADIDEMAENIRDRGYVVTEWKDRRPGTGVRYINDLREPLRTLGVYGNKHVPAGYLRGSEAQRLDLLRGMMDTDGTWNKIRRQAIFTTTDLGLAESVRELAVSLGERVTTNTHRSTGFGITVDETFVSWSPSIHNPFSLSRKANLVTVRDTGKNMRRMITSVEEVESVPTQCIGVEADDSLFLAGKEMVPTHNCGRSKPDDTSQLDGYRLGFEATFGMKPDLAGFFMVRTGTEHLTASLPTFNKTMLDVKFRDAGVRAARAEVGDFELDLTKCEYMCSVRDSCPVKGGFLSELVELPMPTVRTV